MDEYEYKELPKIAGTGLESLVAQYESEGWEFHEVRGSRLIYKRKKK